ncbi:phosphoglycerate dehydrogenase [Gluconacetobacter asukensis]
MEELLPYLPDVDVLCISMMWQNCVLERAPHLKFVQSISAGVDHFPQSQLRERGIPLCSAGGTNAAAVSEHVLACILNISRRLFEARDDQKARRWNPPGYHTVNRPQEVSGKHVIVIGYGQIGQKIAYLCRLLGMTVTAVKRQVARQDDADIEIITPDQVPENLPRADFVVLSCPLTEQTQGLVGRDFLAAMNEKAWLINVARGKVVQEDAMIDALRSGQIGGAALDTFEVEPLPETSSLWGLPNVLMTPHDAGDSQFYAGNVGRLLLDNIARLEGGKELKNRIV